MIKKRFLLYPLLLFGVLPLLIWTMQPESPETEEIIEEKPSLFSQPKPLLFHAAKQVFLNWIDAPNSDSIKADYERLPQDLKRMLPSFINTPLDSAGRSIIFYSKTPADISFFVETFKANIEFTDYFGYTPLQFMTLVRPENVQTLIALGALPNPLTPAPYQMIHQYAIQGLLEPIKTVLQGGQSVDTPVEGTLSTPLLLAARSGKKPMVELLVNKGANLQATDLIGNTPLMTAIQSENADIVYYLITKGAPVNHTNNQNKTPLDLAVYLNNESIVAVLLDNGAPIDTVDRDNKTALMRTIENGKIAMAELLINKGADLNIQDRHGNTALMKAARRGNALLVEKLLEAGADQEIKNQKNETAKDIVYKVYLHNIEQLHKEINPKKKEFLQNQAENLKAILQMLK